MKAMLVILVPTMILVTAVPLQSAAQEEHPGHEQHRHPKYANLENPVPMTTQSIDQGRQLYEKYCIRCHGKEGKGGIGPRLTAPARIHGNTDGELFHVITDGVARTVMKGFKHELSDDMRWHLVNYIKSIGSQQ